LTNDFSQEKRRKDIELHSSTENVNKHFTQLSNLKSEIDKLNSVSHKDRIDELNKLRSDMDSVIEI